MVGSLKLWSSGMYSQNVLCSPLPTLAEPCNAEKTEKRRQTTVTEGTVYLSFFLGRSWLVWPHLRFLQLVARGGRRAWRCVSHPSHQT